MSIRSSKRFQNLFHLEFIKSKADLAATDLIPILESDQTFLEAGFTTGILK